MILYPIGGVTPSSADLSSFVLRTVHALEKAGVIVAHVPSELDKEPTFVTADLEDIDETAIDWCHLYIEPAQLGPSAGTLVYPATEAVWSEEDSPVTKDNLAVPLLDITVLNQVLTVVDDIEKEVSSWAFVEFSYEDARLSSDIHTIRDASHSVFLELNCVRGCEVGWSVIPG